MKAAQKPSIQSRSAIFPPIDSMVIFRCRDQISASHIYTTPHHITSHQQRALAEESLPKHLRGALCKFSRRLRCTRSEI
jgi:hypothetical protein